VAERTTTTPVRLAEIRDEPLSTDEVLAAVHAPAAGGTVLFAGAVRDVDGGRAVTGLRRDFRSLPSPSRTGSES